MSFDERMAGLAARAAEAHAASDGFATHSLTVRVRRGRRVRAAVTAAGTVAALAVVGVVGAAVAGGWPGVPPAGTSEPTEPTIAPPTPEPTPTPSSPTPTSGAGVLEGWTDAGVDPEVFGGVTITGAVAHRGRAVVVGCANGAGLAPAFPAWVAEEPGDWVPATGPGPSDRDGACFQSLAATPHGLFGAFPELYRSEDGYGWTRVDLGLQDTSGYVASAWAVGDRVTALVSRAAEAESRIATLFTTTDGETWQAIDDERARVFDNAGVAAVVTRPDGGLLAVGASPGGEFVPTAAVWLSDDGLTWRLVTPRGEGFADCYATDVVGRADGYTAVGTCLGSDRVTRLAVWTSADGETWSQPLSPPDSADPAGSVIEASVAGVGDVMFVAGARLDPQGSGSSETVLWRTGPDGTWVEVPAADVVPVPFHQVQIGGEAEPGRFRLGFWSPPNGTTGEPVRVLVGAW